MIKHDRQHRDGAQSVNIVAVWHGRASVAIAAKRSQIKSDF
jgi:hypothetical protein